MDRRRTKNVKRRLMRSPNVAIQSGRPFLQWQALHFLAILIKPIFFHILAKTLQKEYKILPKIGGKELYG
jgi:hypothetical protein